MRRRTDKAGKEMLFDRVEDKNQIQDIEKHSENWIPQRPIYNDKCSYYVLQQRDAQNNPTGFYKIIQRDKAKKVNDHLIGNTEILAENSEDDWMYYERRRK